MKASRIILWGVAAAMTGIAAHAGTGAESPRPAARKDKGMKVVRVVPQPGQPGHGWRYFSDRREGRAVVISPAGDYYYSHGEGLELVYKAPPAA